MQSDSQPDPGTTQESRSLTDLWRELGDRGNAWHADRSRADLGRAYIDVRDEFWQRLDIVADGWAR